MVGSKENQFGLEKEVMEACLNIVQQYRTGKTTKAQTTLQLQAAFPEDTEENTYVMAYGSYLEMLNNFNSSQRAACDEAQIKLKGAQEGEEPKKMTLMACLSDLNQSRHSLWDHLSTSKQLTLMEMRTMTINTKGAQDSTIKPYLGIRRFEKRMVLRLGKPATA